MNSRSRWIRKRGATKRCFRPGDEAILIGSTLGPKHVALRRIRRFICDQIQSIEQERHLAFALRRLAKSTSMMPFFLTLAGSALTTPLRSRGRGRRCWRAAGCGRYYRGNSAPGLFGQDFVHRLRTATVLMTSATENPGHCQS
jgi:hypothetical protein